jgi:cobalt-zinc-cadmium efflux system membrane fusion protein
MRLKMAPMAVLAVMGAVCIAALLNAGRRAPALPSTAAPSAPTAAEAEVIAYAPGSPQLTMIRSELLRASPLPLGEPLSARVAYDEDRTVRIGASVGGRITTLRAAPGDAVRAGQLLAEIDSPDFGSARSDLAKALADEERKRLALARARDLGPGEGIAAKDFEAAQADYEAAHAETLRAQQRVHNLNPRGTGAAGERILVTSPLDGVVAERNATPALEVAPGMASPLFVLTDPRHLWLMIDVPEQMLARVRPGSVVAVESDAYPGESFRARIVTTGRVMDPNTRRVLARAALDNPAGKLLPEMLVRASVLQDAGDGVRVPNTGIVDRGLYSYVFVERRPGQFHRQRVQLLSRGAEASFVGSGLAGGERVVTAGALLLDAELGASPAEKP